MKVHHIVQLGCATIFFIASTFISWYQGSQVTNNLLQWGHTTKFTNWFKGPITEESDIMQLDYFLYAARFKPTSVIIMIISFLYIISLVWYLIRKYKRVY
ncbi:YjdJ family protein [Ectobacillus panaciterrae]|uniref:YjdJ family protein n=1 Tax=Ectobacillus panaciterrae TaxID=363872 RepID=UPI000490D010|nr:YjdJ family protein [Ectobacillus panaciterrae]